MNITDEILLLCCDWLLFGESLNWPEGKKVFNKLRHHLARRVAGVTNELHVDVLSPSPAPSVSPPPLFLRFAL